MMATKFTLSSYPHSCQYCGFTSRFISLLLRHYRVEHASNPNFKILCNIESCSSTYTNLESWRKHISRKHKSFNATTFLQKTLPLECYDYCNDMELNSGNSTVLSAPNEASLNESTSGSFSFHNELQNFMLNLRVKKYVPESVTAIIAQKFENVVHDCLIHTKELAQKTGKLNESDIGNICSPLQTLTFNLEDINTSQKQNRIFRKKPFVSPISCMLNKPSESFIYIPVLDGLKNLLAHDDILSYIWESPPNSSTISSFCTSLKFKESAFFQQPNTVQLELYMDDFTLTNPLGTSSKKHKICAFYLTLGNIPHYLKSKLYTIQLVGLVQNFLIKQHGFHKILEPFLKDLQLFETEGLQVMTSAGMKTFHGSLSVFIADNLASHELGGFMTSFSGFRRCRFCNATSETMQSSFNEADFTLRTPSSYDAQVSLVEQNAYLSSTYGVKQHSVLNQLNYFHVCWGSPSDISHDLFEGVCLDLIKLVLEHAIAVKVISLSSLNNIISEFPYMGKDKKNKPALLSGTSNNIIVKQTAAQCQNLIRILPLIIGHKMPHGDLYWDCYLCFLKCLDYILAPKLHPGEVQFMEDLIATFISSYSKLDSVTNIKPKMHYMIHYGSQYRFFGALVNYSTLRFEAKHSNLKSYFANCKNYRNPCLTIANRHQYLQTLHCSNEFFLNEENLNISKRWKTIPLLTLPPTLVNDFKSIVNVDTNLLFYTFIECNSMIYRKGMAVVTDIELDTFAIIHEVTYLQGAIYLILQTAMVTHFKAHLNAYAVELKNSKVVQSLNLLPCRYTLPVYDVEGEKLIILHHYISDCT